MDVVNIITNIIISVFFGGVAGFGLFKWLGQSWMKNWFAKDLKKYEQQLDLLKMQKSLQYSNVYAKRADIISTIYSNIVKIDIADSIIRAAEFKDEDQRQETFRKYSTIIFESIRFASENGIYLTESIRSRLTALHDKIVKDIIPELKYLESLTNEEYKIQVKNIPDYDVKEIMKELMLEFQIILGIDK